MTDRQALIRDVSRHLKDRDPSTVTGVVIQEAISELHMNSRANGYDWTRLRNAIARRQHELYTQRNFRSEVTLNDVPALT